MWEICVVDTSSGTGVLAIVRLFGRLLDSQPYSRAFQTSELVGIDDRIKFPRLVESLSRRAAARRSRWGPNAGATTGGSSDRNHGRCSGRPATPAVHTTRGTGTSRREPRMDSVDRRLLDVLRADGRASYAELARSVG